MRISRGFVLAATVAEDDAAATARAGTVDALAERLAAEAQEIASLPAADRRSRIRSDAASLRQPPPVDAVLPPRARALLAPEMPPAVGRQWMASAPRPRRGYAVPPGLRDVLRRVGARDRPADPEQAEGERRTGRELVACHLRELDDERERSALLDELGAWEAGAVLALEEAPQRLDHAARAAFLDAARRTPALDGADRTRAAGAMALAYLEGPGAGDGWSEPFRRAGRELRELMEARCRG